MPPPRSGLQATECGRLGCKPGTSPVGLGWGVPEVVVVDCIKLSVAGGAWGVVRLSR